MSVVIGLERIVPEALPEQLAIAVITLAELAAGPHATRDVSERARRQQRLQLAEATFDSSRLTPIALAPMAWCMPRRCAPAARRAAREPSTC